MSLIFDRFATVEHAKAFQEAVEKQFPEYRTALWMSQENMEALMGRKLNGTASAEEMKIEADVFPFQLDPPIVLVSRRWEDSYKDEEPIEKLVEQFGGVFAGT